jgi:hypothetical protein
LASNWRADGGINDAPMRCAGGCPFIAPYDRRHVLDAEAAYCEADDGRAAKRCKALSWQLLAEIGYLDNLLAKTQPLPTPARISQNLRLGNVLANRPPREVFARLWSSRTGRSRSAGDGGWRAYDANERTLIKRRAHCVFAGTCDTADRLKPKTLIRLA